MSDMQVLCEEDPPHTDYRAGKDSIDVARSHICEVWIAMKAAVSASFPSICHSSVLQ